MSQSASHPGFGLLRLLKWLVAAAVCLLLLAVLGVWSVGRAIPSLLDSALSSQAASGLTCERNDTNLFAGRIDLSGLSILNPPGFNEREFVHVRHLVVDVQPLSFVYEGRRVIEEVTLDLDRVTIVGKGDLFGANNATEIAKAFRRSATANPPTSRPTSGAVNDFIIRRLRIRVGGVTLMQENGPHRTVLVSDSRELSFEAADVTAENLGDTVVAPLGGLALTRAASADPDALVDLARRQLEHTQK